MRAVLSACKANATLAQATKLQSVKSQCCWWLKQLQSEVFWHQALISKHCQIGLTRSDHKIQRKILSQNVAATNTRTKFNHCRTQTHTHIHTDAHWYTLSKTIRIVWWGIFRAKLSGGEIAATDGWTFFFPQLHMVPSLKDHCSLSHRGH